ncbi:hypothetical protein BsWGS_25586 [Bradybaena similaris]
MRAVSNSLATAPFGKAPDADAVDHVTTKARPEREIATPSWRERSGEEARNAHDTKITVTVLHVEIHDVSLLKTTEQSVH